MNLLYCDCFSGISGDMMLGALLDAGLPVDHLLAQFRKLDLPEFKEIKISKVMRSAIAATLVEMEILDHHHEPDGHHHHAHERNLRDIGNLIDKSGLSEKVKQISIDIFKKLAEAEAKVHGTSVEDVHFHEVGAVDSILDIVGAAVGLEFFDIHLVYASPLPLGSGCVQTRHGQLPLPAPATLELMRIARAPVNASSAQNELVTPTGAAILAALADFNQPDMVLKQVGIGAGQRDLEWPNILRIMIGEQVGESHQVVEIATNIDDMNPQVYAHVMEKLFHSGALDVYFTPIYMKKNRPATKIAVIANKKDEERICQILLQETSTLGVRVMPVSRHEAQREMRSVETRFGQVKVKIKFQDGQIAQATPEFDDCARLSKELDVPVIQVIEETVARCHDLLG